jgi:superoxide dismutase, Cu-Zn family
VHTFALDSRGDTLKRITKAALGGLAGCALVLGGTQVASGALSNILKIQGSAEDLMTTTDGTLDSARAKITINEGTDSTTFSIRVTGIDPSQAGNTLGSHLHIGPCVEGTGGAAGGHYNHAAALGVSPAPVSPETEVWFDLVADENGMAYDETTVPFVPIDSALTDSTGTPGVMSVVVHLLPTNTELNYPNNPGAVGFAGGRQACFPVLVPQWAGDEAS